MPGNVTVQAYQITPFSDLSLPYAEYDRFYVGDQHCEHNCFAALSDPELRDFLVRHEKPVTVLTPQVSELLFDRFVPALRSLVAGLPDPEVVVNDYGMLREFRNGEIRPVLGNALAGQSKDPMIRDFSAKGTHVRLGADLPFYAKLLSENGIRAIELFHTFQGWEVTNLPSVDVHLHLPYVPYSQTRYCRAALASQGKDYLEVVTECPGCRTVGAKKMSLILAKRAASGPIENLYVANRQMYRNDSGVTASVARIVHNHDLSLG